MQKYLFIRKRPILFFTLCLALLFWLFFLTHTVTKQFTMLSNKSIPAFLNTDCICPADLESLSQKAELLNQTTARIPLSCFPDEQEHNWSEKQLLSLLQQYDSQICLISAQKEKNYTDYYFYSPKISQDSQTALTENFNLQAAITHNYVYFGIPLIQYDF